MSEPQWTPVSRTLASTLTKVLRSTAFFHSREAAASIMDSPAELHSLAAQVEALDCTAAPLCTIADRIAAAVRFLRATADRLGSASVGTPYAESGESPPAGRAPVTAGDAARERLVVAGLHYLITPDDLMPDFRPGGYLDDVLLLSWVFGAAINELTPHQDHPGDPDDAAGPLASAEKPPGSSPLY